MFEKEKESQYEWDINRGEVIGNEVVEVGKPDCVEPSGAE